MMAHSSSHSSILLDRSGLIVTCQEIKKKQQEGPSTTPSQSDKHNGKRKMIEHNTDRSDSSDGESSCENSDLE